MGLAWLSPWYLFGSLLVVLPVLVHLVQRQNQQGMKFPSLMFLRQIPYREKRRLKIRHWWLLLIRCLLLLLLAAAFARPFLNASVDNSLLDLARRDSVILLDKSYSMRSANHWQQAQEFALDLVTGKSPLDRIALLGFDHRVETISDFSNDSELLSRLIKRQQPGLQTTHFRAAIEQAAKMLNGSDASDKQILMISDFQASGASAAGPARIASDTSLRAYPVNPTSAPNAGVSSIAVEPSPQAAQGRMALSVQITNYSNETIQQTLVLTLDGQQRLQREVSLAPTSQQTQSFTNLRVENDILRVVASLSKDALELDNHAYFAYAARQRIPVLILEGSQSRRNQSLYLEQALALSTLPLLQVRSARMDEILPGDLSAQALIIINDAAIPGGAVGAALEAFVRGGGGLLVGLGESVQANWPSDAEGFLPGKLARRVESAPGQAHQLVALDPDHSFSVAIDALGKSGLSSARIFKYRALQANTGDRVIAAYQDGGVALIERQVGLGRVLVITTTLDPHWNDLALQPIFLPFLYQSLRHLAAFEAQPTSFALGSVVDLVRYARAFAGADAVVAAGSGADLVVELPAGSDKRLSRDAPLLSLDQPGLYQVHRATPAGVAVILAANIDPVEADLKVLDVAQFVEEINVSAVPVSSDADGIRQAGAQREQQQQLWYALLVLLLGLLLVEALAANWIVRSV